jgi:hypothetical protein
MKKIEKLILADAKLNSEELKILRGGYSNTNEVKDCCLVNDNEPSLVRNTNSVFGCICNCDGY